MNRHDPDDFYEGPPIEDADHWHDGAVLDTDRAAEADVGGSSQPTADPSLSRTVDRRNAGAPSESAGYDRSGEGAAPGPLEPRR